MILQICRSVFICPVPTSRAFDEAVRAIETHNLTSVEYLGMRTAEEAARIDPMRSKFLCAMAEGGLFEANKGECTIPLQLKFTRGEDIRVSSACLVDFRGQMWLEVTNGGGGADTTEFLQSNFPACGWIGTEGKPDGFMDAPMIADTDSSLKDLKVKHSAKLN